MQGMVIIWLMVTGAAEADKDDTGDTAEDCEDKGNEDIISRWGHLGYGLVL